MSIEELPPGWERRESKSQPGRYYYVSPQGQTQWFPPRRVPGVRQFNWRCEIEIEFGPGRLGVNLKEVPQTTNLPFPMFQAEVEELPKLPGGKPGPAEIYNWSVRPERRLTPGMRLTQIDGVVLAGNRYTEVVDRLKRAARPVKLKFADVAQGLLGEGETADTTPAAVAVAAPSAAAPSAYSVQKQKKEEYMNLLVTSELSNEMWRLETQKVKSQFIALQYKWNVLSASFSALMEDKLKSKREIEASMTEKAKYEEMLKQLKLQESGAIISPEVQRMNELSSKNAELTDDIGKMGAANKKLRRERDLNQRQLDELEAQLVHGVSQPLPESLVGIDPLLEPSAKIEIIAQKIAAMQFELQREEMKTKQAEVELAQLSKVYNQQTEVILESSRGGMMMPLPDMRRQMERTPLPPVAESKPPLPPAPTPPPPPPQPQQQQHSSFLGSSRGGFYNRSNSAQMTANIVRQGHLEKFPTHFNQEGGGMLQSMRLMRGSRERWCQLTSTGTLVYYKKRGDPVPRGEIALTDPTLEVVCEAMSSSSSGRRPPKELIFTVSTTQAQNRFQAATMDDMRGWVTAILTFHSGWMNSRASLTENQTVPAYMDESSARRAVEF
ncbi:unnamed protein product [Aphanomyces euteiches]